MKMSADIPLGVRTNKQGFPMSLEGTPRLTSREQRSALLTRYTNEQLLRLDVRTSRSERFWQTAALGGAALFALVNGVMTGDSLAYLYEIQHNLPVDSFSAVINNGLVDASHGLTHFGMSLQDTVLVTPAIILGAPLVGAVAAGMYSEVKSSHAAAVSHEIARRGLTTK